MHNDPTLKIDVTEIPVVRHQFLGIIFYFKLTFIPHIKALRIKAIQSGAPY